MTGFIEIHEGRSPLILSMPHCGHGLAPGLEPRLSDAGRARADTDWWIERLYGFYPELDASMVRSELSRLVIDLNRDPSGRSLYPGQNTTGLCATETFDGEAIYQVGGEPDDAEIAGRIRDYFDPYHRALSDLIARTAGRHGFALLFDCHSIRSVVPRLFDGTLPDFNIGTDSGKSCAPVFERIMTGAVRRAPEYSVVANGRFTGGWITRHYGNPAANVHAVQLELAQSTYMLEAPPWTYDEARAARLHDVLRAMLRELVDWSVQHLGEAA